MNDVRHAFSEASAGFFDAVLSIPEDAWSTPGLGVWTVRELVGHTSRALVTIEDYLDTMPAEVTIRTPVDYYTAGLKTRRRASTTAWPNAAVRPERRSETIRSRRSARSSSAWSIESRVNPTTRSAPPASAAMLLIDYLPTRIVELTVHCIDLTDALDRPPTVPAGSGRAHRRHHEPGSRSARGDQVARWAWRPSPRATTSSDELATRPGRSRICRSSTSRSVVAGPGVRPLPRRLRRRCHQGRTPGWRRHAAQHGLARSATTTSPCGGSSVGRGKRSIALDLKSADDLDAHAPAVRRGRRARRELPARHPRTARPAARRRCWPRNPKLVITRITGFGQDGPYAPSGLRHHRRGDVRLRRDQRRARRGPAAATDRAHRRGHRARRRVRHDGRRALRRRPGRRRQPARVALPAHGSADRRATASSATSNPAWGRASPTRCPAAPSVRRRQVGRDLDVCRVGRIAGDGARRPRRRRALRDLRRARRASRRGRSRRARVDRRPLLRRGARCLRDRRKPRSLPS